MISQADLELHLGLTAGTDTALLVDLEAQAVEWLENATGGRYFSVSASTIDYLKGHGEPELFLDEQIGSITSIVEQSYEGDTAAETLTAGDDDGYVIRGQRVVRKGGWVWDLGKEYVVTWVRGYTAVSPATTPESFTDSPAEIEGAVRQLVAFWYLEGKPWKAASQLTSETIGDYAYTRGALTTEPESVFNLIPGLRQTVGAWRIPRL